MDQVIIVSSPITLEIILDSGTLITSQVTLKATPRQV